MLPDREFLKEGCRLLYGNIDKYGPMAVNFCRSPCARSYQAIGLVEHHVATKGLRAVTDNFTKVGRRMFASPAIPTLRSDEGTHGGALIAPSNHLCLAPMPVNKKNEVTSQGHDWICIPIRTKGVTFLYVVAYLTPSIGATGVNVVKLQELLNFLLKDGRPFVIAADWNMTPAELNGAKDWLTKLNAGILIPKDVVSTCNSGRLIDYVVVRNDFRDAVLRLEPEDNVPWRTHMSLRIIIAHSPRSILVRTLVKPSRLDKLPDVAPPLEWAVAQSRAAAAPILNTGTRDHNLVVFGRSALASFESDALTIGDEYRLWSAASELCLLSQKGISPENFKRYSGRGDQTAFRIGPLLPKAPFESTGFHGEEALFWATMSARVTQLFLLRKRAKGLEQQRNILMYLKHSACPQIWEWAWNATELPEQIALYTWFYRLSGGCLAVDEVQRSLIADSRARSVKAGRAHRAEIAMEVRKWTAASIAGGAAAAHKYIRKADITESPLPQGVLAGELVVQPIDILDAKLQFWNGFWQRGGPLTDNIPALTPLNSDGAEGPADGDGSGCMVLTGADKLMSALKDLRTRSRWEVNLPTPITVEQVTDCLRHLKPDRGLGCDHWAPREMLQLPPEALEGLTRLLNNIEAKGVFPQQVLMNLICLLPKPTGGERPICLASLLYVVWSGIRSPIVRDWDARRAGHWDDAVRGSSALKAALKRRILDECAVLKRESTAGIYWDVEKFYDSINIVRLAELSQEFNFPIAVSSLDLQVHVAPRVVRWANFYSEATPIFSSILAGSKFSNSYARIALYRLLDAAHAQLPDQVRQYVDDLAQVQRGTSNQCYNKIVEGARLLYEGLTEEGLKVSPKSTIVCSSATLAFRVHSKLLSLGIEVSVARGVRDLGIDAGGGRHKPVAVRNQRLDKVKGRARRVSQLGRWCKKASKLYNTNIWPAASYGMAAYGCPPGVIRQLRSTAALCTSSKSGACTTSAIAIGLPPGSDPAIALRVEILKCWIDFWAGNTHLHEELLKSWMKLVPKLKLKATRWRQVGGPVGAAVATLYDIGWKPVSPNGWIQPDGSASGQQWRFAGYGDSCELYSAVEKSAMKEHWAHAATRWSGSGAAGGVDVSVLKRHLAQLERKDLPGRVGLLNSVAMGATWPRQRKFEAGLAESAICPRCGEADETDLHRFWTCPKNLEIDDPAVRCTNSMSPSAILDNNANSVFWCRGLVPQAWVESSPPTPDPTTRMVGDRSLWRPAIYFTDGSGGDKGSDPRLRRCGWGVVRLDLDDPGNPKIACGAYGPLHGPRQTVPRSELYAAIQVLTLVQSGDVVIFSDCSYFVDHAGSMEKRECLCLGRNGDLWTMWWDLRDKRDGRTIVKKVKAHSVYSDLCSGAITLENFRGNALADYLAGKGAELGRVDSNKILSIEFTDGQAWKIQNRLLAILKSIYASSPEAEPKRVLPPVLQPAPILAPPLVRLAALGHKLVRTGDRWRCSECVQCCHNSWLKTWCLGGECVPLALRTVHGMQNVVLGCAPILHPVYPSQVPVGMEPVMTEIVYGPYAEFTAAYVTDMAAAIPAPAIRDPPAAVAHPPAARAIRVGRQTLHHSHTILYKRGVYWCQRCGGFAELRGRVLLNECLTRPTREGRQVLRRLNSNLPPTTKRPWPLAEGEGPLEGLLRPYTDGPFEERVEPLRDG